ncbi:hypothetical protein H312_01270 [Anncaliia algerae PRA339]|uniref:Uncharacterized protein n=1 Tax=Anncaliia algerae PRA339 TaxID=1288291 RepID=A0A059F2P5_9MICR|nr:hypothetical protein H312_01270 [Anncaliia algerae PRA339]
MKKGMSNQSYTDTMDQELNKLLNELILDYLTKQGYNETIEVFQKETGLEAPSKTEFSSLRELITMFISTLDTRCGKIRQGPDFNRIEAVMMRINAEKQRCLQVVSPNKLTFSNEPMRSYVSPRLRRTIPEPPKERFMSPEDENLDCKVVKSCRIHQLKINTGIISPCNNLLITGGNDCSINIYNLLTHENFNKQIHKPIKMLKMREIGNEILIATGFLDSELQLFKYSNHNLVHINGIQTPGAAIVGFEFAENCLFTVDCDGKFVNWSFSGKFISMHQLIGNILDMVYFANHLIINEVNKVTFLNLGSKEGNKLFLNHSVSVVKKVNDFLLIAFQNVVQIYNSSFEVIEMVEAPKAVKSATILKSGQVVFACENFIMVNGKNMPLKLFNSPVLNLDAYCERESQYLSVTSFDGEIKIVKINN